MKRFTTLLVILKIILTPPSVIGQKSAILDGYITEGLKSNATLKTTQFDITRSLNALDQAKTLFMPQVSFQIQYTLAAGGRVQPLPIGDLLNPVYNTLNQITQSNNFQTVDNQDIYFLPNNFHDTKIHAVYPILNKEIFYNREIKKQLISIEQAKVQAYKRELVRNIKTAYVQYLQAVQAVYIYQNALTLVRENERFNRKLVKNDVATPAVVIKAQSEVAKVENSIVEAENQAKNAAAYFNFLINKPFETPIEIDTTLQATVLDTEQIPMINADTPNNREEISQINEGIKTIGLQQQMAEAYKKPKIGAFLDAGFQGFGFKVWDNQAYLLAGFQIEVPLYTAGNNKLKVQQAQIEGEKMAAQRAEVMQQIALQIQVAQTNYATAQAALKANDAELSAAREYYRLTERRYREGQALQLELTDARTQLTSAELKKNVALYAVLLKAIELERVTARYEF